MSPSLKPEPTSSEVFIRSWGAELMPHGRARFRLWAPGAERLDLDLDGERHAMEPLEGGWHHIDLPARAGQSYHFVLPNGLAVPDPAARAQAGDVHGPSRLVDPRAYQWRHNEWQGRPWHETVLYEAHVGTFTSEGTFDAMRRKLDHLVDLGVNALELMPVAQFGGRRGWGYDGVLLYAPHEAYGSPDDMKRLIDEAHGRGLQVFLDVVYNHFGPDGNYLGAYAPDFFHPERHTPWGAAIAYDLKPVRDFFIENALYWLEEYRIDGLRLDAIDSIEDASEVDIIEDIARAVREHPFAWRRHLTTEDARNITRLHERGDNNLGVLYDGEWNDDFHNSAHVLATGETEGYYCDHAPDARGDFLRCLESGFAFQGQDSAYRGTVRGKPSGHLPPAAFVNFLQNHDQAGNRAFGSRLSTLASPRAVEVLTTLLLLGPAVPMLFMGEEWGETDPYLFHTDFEGNLADAVRKGRREEFKDWADFADPELRETIPDPNAKQTRDTSRLDWSKVAEGKHAGRLELIARLIALRAEHVTPRTGGMRDKASQAKPHGRRGIEVVWTLDDGSKLGVVANLGNEPFHVPELPGDELIAIGDPKTDEWAVRWTLERPSARPDGGPRAS